MKQWPFGVMILIPITWPIVFLALLWLMLTWMCRELGYWFTFLLCGALAVGVIWSGAHNARNHRSHTTWVEPTAPSRSPEEVRKRLADELKADREEVDKAKRAIDESLRK